METHSFGVIPVIFCFMVRRATLKYGRKILGVAFSFSGCCLLWSLGKSCSAGLWLHLWQTTESGQRCISTALISLGEEGQGQEDLGIRGSTQTWDEWHKKHDFFTPYCLYLFWEWSVSQTKQTTEGFFRQVFSENIPVITGKTHFSLCCFRESLALLAILHLLQSQQPRTSGKSEAEMHQPILGWHCKKIYGFVSFLPMCQSVFLYLAL